MNKKCKVFMFPTSETVSRILYSKNTNTLEYNPFLKTNSSDKYQHIYITSDEKIKEGDWYIHFNTYTKESSLFKSDDKFNEGNNPNIIDKRDFVYEYWNKKIIATTDTSLISINEQYFDVNKSRKSAVLEQKTLPQPPQEFIEFYVKAYNEGNPITEVMVEYVCRSNASLGYNEYVYLEHVAEKRYIPIKIDININQDSFTLGKEEEFEDWEIETTLKINSNTISIKPIKDRWTKEEVKQLCKLAFKYHCDNSRTTSLPDKWIEENL